MSQAALQTTEPATPQTQETPGAGHPAVIALSEFLADFGDDLLEATRAQNPPLYDGAPDSHREAVLQGLLRTPFAPQAAAVQALARLLIDAPEHGAILMGEMGTGKTLMAAALASVLHAEGYRRSLVIAPPHLVYKWRREILETVPMARVWVLNGPDTLRKLLTLRVLLQEGRAVEVPEFFILGRVRMRMGFHWRPAVAVRKEHVRLGAEAGQDPGDFPPGTYAYAACPRCGGIVTDSDGEPVQAGRFPEGRRERCRHCGEALWRLIRPRGPAKDRRALVKEALCRFPTIGPKTSERLLGQFGHEALGGMLEDNVYELLNLMDEDGELVFSDRQAQRMERALSGMEIAFGQGGYQPSEFIKRYLPDGYFTSLFADKWCENGNVER